MAALKPFADDLEDQLTCPICQEIFTDPKTLSCLHNFCSKCIVDWYERREDPDTKELECTMCRVQIAVPGGDATKLRSAFNLKSLLQLLEAARTKSDQEQAGLPVCMSCEKHFKLVAFCVQCDGLICNVCLDSHKTVKQLRQEHHVQLVADFKKENVESFVKSQMFCQEKFHERNKLEYYCKEETCKKCVCQKCAFLHHRNHDMLSIEQAAEVTTQVAKLEMEKVNQLKENYKEELVQSKMNTARIEKDIDLAKQKVTDVVESICKTVRDHETAITNKLDGILTERQKASQDEQRDIEAGINELVEFLLRCETMLDKSPASEIAVSKDDLQQRCQSYLERLSILPSKPIQRNVIVCYVTNQEVTQSLQNVGRVHESVVDPLHSSIEPMKEVRCGFVNDFVIITRNSEDEVCHTDKGSIDVRIKDPEGNEVERRLTEQSTGKYRVSYRAEKTVQYEVQVNISDQPIRNSPQKVNTLDINTEFVHVKTFQGIEGEDGSESGAEELWLSFMKKISVSDVNQEIAVLDPKEQCIKIFDVFGNSLRSLKVVSPEMEESKHFFLSAFVLNENKITASLFYPQNKMGVLQELDLNGTLLNTIYPSDLPILPISLCLTEDQNLAVCCQGSGAFKLGVKLFSKQGELIREFDGIKEYDDPYFITYNNGKHFVSFGHENCIRVFDKNGAFLYEFGEEGELGGQFRGVFGLTGYGPDMILACDVNNHRVQLLTTHGEFITSFSRYDSGVIEEPYDVAVGADGKVFVLQYDGKVHIWR